MYRAFIVDDDAATRDGLRNYFNWAKYDVEIVGDASDGDEAYEQILDLKPDILISDVKMPRMDGTVLLQKLLAAGMRIAVLFISGYSEVALVKSAIRFGASDYILKPLDLSELETAVSRIVARLHDDALRAEKLNKMEAQLRRSMPLLRARYFLGLLNHGAESFSEIQADAEFLGLELDPGDKVNAFILTIDEYGSFFNPTAEKEKYLCSFAVLNIISDLFDGRWHGYAAQEGKQQFAGMLHDKHLDPDELGDFYIRLRDILEETLGIVVSVGAGTVVDSVTEIVSSYQVAKENIKDRFLHGSGIYAAQGGQQRKKADMLLAYQYLEGLRLDLPLYQDPARMDAFVEDIFGRLLSVEDIGEEDIKTFCFHIVYKLHDQLTGQDAAGAVDFRKQNDAINSVFGQSTLEGLKHCLGQYFRDTVHSFCQRQGEYASSVVLVKRILKEEYAYQWTLDELAGRVNISKAYMCTLFKQSTGQTIMDYLAKTRVYKAAGLLLAPKNKINEVGDMVGYGDPGYFTRIFKKYLGVSPSQYRGNLRERLTGEGR